MKIYLVTRTDYSGYDSYDAVVICEETPRKAMSYYKRYGFHKDKMYCKLIGTALKSQEAGEILASFNAA